MVGTNEETVLIAHQLLHYDPPSLRDKSGLSHGQRVAALLEQSPDAFVKTLVVETERGAALVLLPVLARLDLSEVEQALGVNQARLMPADRVKEATGMVPGGASPFLRSGSLPVIMDPSLFNHEEIVVSAGEPGLAVRMPPQLVHDLISN